MTDTIGQELTPTRLLIDWLTDAPDAVEDLHSHVAITRWVDETTDTGSESGGHVTPAELADLQDYLDGTVRRHGDLKGLREDLTKYGTQFAPSEIGDIKGFVDWSLGQVDWQEVHAFIAAHPVAVRDDGDA